MYKNQYMPLCNSVQTILEEEYPTSEQEIWYKIGTTPEIYEACKDIIHIGLTFLVRDPNQCSVESVIVNLQKTDAKDRPRILHDTVTMQEFIIQNAFKGITILSIKTALA